MNMNALAFRSFLLAALAIALPLAGGSAVLAANDVTGNYVCASMGGKPCDTQTQLRLLANGYWGFGKYSGQYQVNGGNVEFVNGSGGPVTWGPAKIGPNSLTFEGDVVFQKPSAQRAALAGTYRCQTAPGGCLTRNAIVLDGQGAWRWGAQGGSYAVLGDQIRFNGLSSGPAGWGPAAIGNGTLTFSTSSGSSTWVAGP